MTKEELDSRQPWGRPLDATPRRDWLWFRGEAGLPEGLPAHVWDRIALPADSLGSTEWKAANTRADALAALRDAARDGCVG